MTVFLQPRAGLHGVFASVIDHQSQPLSQPTWIMLNMAGDADRGLHKHIIGSTISTRQLGNDKPLRFPGVIL
jgi:hypothetical protein